jgi:hypothetical protein
LRIDNLTAGGPAALGAFMNSRLTHRTRLLPVILVAAMAVSLPTQAEAGCLSEHDGCVQCARRMLRSAMLRFDLGGIREANVALWDCEIDLYHCVLFGQHHETSCAL